jgi:hypothetical protein
MEGWEKAALDVASLASGVCTVGSRFFLFTFAVTLLCRSTTRDPITLSLLHTLRTHRNTTDCKLVRIVVGYSVLMMTECVCMLGVAVKGPRLCFLPCHLPHLSLSFSLGVQANMASDRGNEQEEGRGSDALMGWH